MPVGKVKLQAKICSTLRLEIYLAQTFSSIRRDQNFAKVKPGPVISQTQKRQNFPPTTKKEYNRED